MRITATRTKLAFEEKVKGFVDVTFDDCFVVRGLKVIDGSRGMFVSMPSRKRPDGTHQDIAFPANSEMRKVIEESVLNSYRTELRAHAKSEHVSAVIKEGGVKPCGNCREKIGLNAAGMIVRESRRNTLVQRRVEGFR